MKPSETPGLEMNSFRRRLALAGVLTSAVALLVVLLVQGRAVNIDTRAETQERLRAEARILAEALSGPWSTQGPGPWIEELVDRIYGEIAAHHEREVPYREIGEQVMRGLRGLD